MQKSSLATDPISKNKTKTACTCICYGHSWPFLKGKKHGKIEIINVI